MSKDLKWLKFCIDGAQTFSTCAKRKYFSVIIDRSGHVIGTGWNGVPKGMRHCDQNGCPRLADNSPNGSTYDNCRSIHAESNALLHSDYMARKDGCTLYVNGPPCFWCAKLIANSGVKRVVYLNDDSYTSFEDVVIFLIEAGVSLEGFSKDEVNLLSGVAE